MTVSQPKKQCRTLVICSIVRILYKYQYYYDLIIVDSPPSQLASTIARSALITADLALIPVGPPLDMWEVTEMNHIVDEVNELRQSTDVAPITSRIVLTRARKNTRMTNFVLETFITSRFPICKSIIREREVYKLAAFKACSIYDLKETVKNDAVVDMDDLYSDIIPLLDMD